MIDPVMLGIVYVYTYTRPSFFSLQYWPWPFLYMFGFAGIFAMPGMMLGVDGDDFLFLVFLGMTVGTMLGIISSIIPYYILVLVLIPLIFIRIM